MASTNKRCSGNRFWQLLLWPPPAPTLSLLIVKDTRLSCICSLQSRYCRSTYYYSQLEKGTGSENWQDTDRRAKEIQKNDKNILFMGTVKFTDDPFQLVI